LKLKQEGRADGMIAKIEWLLSFAYPKIGDRPIKEIGERPKYAGGTNRPAGSGQRSEMCFATRWRQTTHTHPGIEDLASDQKAKSEEISDTVFILGTSSRYRLPLIELVHRQFHCVGLLKR